MRKKIAGLLEMIWVLKHPNLTCVHGQVAKVDCECPLYFKPEEIPVSFL